MNRSTEGAPRSPSICLPMDKILLVEDEKNFAQVLRDYLSMNGYAVTVASNGIEGFEAFKEEEFSLCLLDVMMPKMDGFSLAEHIRKSDKQVPMIFLTARGLRDDMVRGYRTGADDYIIKPFDSEVLLLKIKVILERRQGHVAAEHTEHTIGIFSFNARLRSLVAPGGKTTRLSPKEAALLDMLCHHRNDVLPRGKALKKIWKDDNYFTARSMDVYIVKLRKYLAADPLLEISNVHGNGYSLIEKK